jgi:DNA-binding beta-propeller fold protein YncE
MKRVCGFCLAVIVIFSLAPWIRAQKNSAPQEDQPLILTTQLPLPGVHGRFDHFAYGAGEPGRNVGSAPSEIFISALGNNSVEVINLVEGTEVHRITGIPEPQGVTYAPGLNKLFVASRKGTLYIYDGGTYNLITSIAYNADVDNLRYDAASKRVYVGYGDGDKAAIGMIDATTNKRLDEEYTTGVHPESFQLETSGSKIYVNLRDSQKVGVIDRTTKKMSIWPLPAHIEDNFPMALNEAEHRLFVITRTPPRLVIFDTTSGTVVAALPCVADSDDLYYDSKRKRIYIAGGQGFIDVFQEKDPDHFARLAKIPTVIGARTAGYSGRLYLAVPATPGKDAAIWWYSVAE